MAELHKLIHSINGNFKSDLMKVFVESDFSKTEASPTSLSDIMSTNLNQNVKTGACIFTTIASTLTDTNNANILTARDVTNNQTMTTSTITTANNNSPLVQQIGTNDNINTNNPNITLASLEMSDPSTNISEVAAILDEVKKSTSDIKIVLAKQVTKATVDAHVSTCKNTHKAVTDTKARLKATKKETGGLQDVRNLSLNASYVWQNFTAQMKPGLAQVIKFCKLLPGFSEISGDDQIKLIKQGSFEVMLVRSLMLIDHEKETMIDPSHSISCTRHVMQQMPLGAFFDDVFPMARKFNPLNLTDDEIGLFTAVLCFSPDRAGLKDKKVISKIQSLYYQALFDLLKQNHSNPEMKFTELIGLVPFFRLMNEKHTLALKKMKMEAPEAFDNHFPALHKELYSEHF